MWPISTIKAFFDRKVKDYIDRTVEAKVILAEATLKKNLEDWKRFAVEDLTAAFNMSSKEFIRKHGNIAGVEVDYERRGYICIIGRIQNQDIVRVIPIEREMDVQSYNTIVHWVQKNLGYGIDFTDAPIGLTDKLTDNYHVGHDGVARVINKNLPVESKPSQSSS